MECNRDEALRAKEIAERKYAENDITCARKFALKAQALFPGLDGISQMIATLDVHAAAAIRINGEKDWYAILCLNPRADEEMIKKQYRKLALVLHPDKNKSIGGEAAFQIISEAFSVLSDKAKRMVYNHKRNSKVGQQTSGAGWGSSGGLHPAAKTAANNFKTQRSSVPSNPGPSAVPTTPSPRSVTFWTLCPYCKMQYEYIRLYFNHTLLCPKCHRPFLATETKNPTQEFSTTVPMRTQQALNQQKNRASVAGMGSTGFQHGASFAYQNNLNSQFGAFYKTAERRDTLNSVHTVNQDPNSTIFTKRNSNGTNLASDRERKICEEKIQAMAAEKLLKMRLQKQAADGSATGSPKINLTGSASHVKQTFPLKPEMSAKKRKVTHDVVTGTVYGDQRLQSNGSKMENMNVVAGDSVKAKVVYRQSSILKRDISHLHLQNMLRQKAQKLIRMKLEAWKVDTAAKLMAQQEKEKQKKKQKQSAEKEKDILIENRHDDMKTEETNIGDKHIDCKEKVVMQNLHDKSDKEEKDLVDEREGGDAVNIDVPDPDFHDFDKDRSENAFEPEQIWAIYDNEDGMPRYYALVQKVLSRKPFKIRISYLACRTNSEFSPLNWVRMGFAKVCGNFRIGKYETCDSINMFSHEIRPERGPGGIIKILPRKGDIWALYRNWSPEWNEHTPDDVMYKYDMVEVLEDYVEKVGIAVIPLLKCAGFKTVFSRSTDMKDVMRIPKEEMLRFSHQVPCHLLTGEEAQNAPSGCYELDPAATPLELLQATAEVMEDEPMETTCNEKANEELEVEIT